MAFDYQIINCSFSIPLPHLLDKMDGAQIIHFYFLPIFQRVTLHFIYHSLLRCCSWYRLLISYRLSSWQHLSTSQTTTNLSSLSSAEAVVSFCFGESELSWCVGCTSEILQCRSNILMENHWWRFRSSYGCFFTLGSRTKKWRGKGIDAYISCVDIQSPYADFSSSIPFRWEQRKYSQNCLLMLDS